MGAIAGPIIGGLIGASGARSAAKTAAAGQERAAELAYEQSLPWDVKGMFGSATFDEDGRAADIQLDPEMKALYDRLYGRAGGYAEQVEAMGKDPLAMQQKFYEEQKAIAAPGEEKDRLALENRLLAQGMLGSTGGASRMGELQTAQGMKDLVRRADAMSQSQQMLDLYRTRETGDIKQALGIGALPYDYATLGRGIGGGMSGAATYGAGLRSEGAKGIGATTANAWGGLGRQIGEADWGNMYGNRGGGYQGSYDSWGNQGGFEFDQGGPEFW
jgi:hypothetical protein